MAQAEDTELRDLVIEALEKNGSLAKIRALLRANVFLAFENECENIKQNMSLDNILKLPEGILALSIVHEFLEFCNLKNTLFVYMAETRQKKEYVYEGQKLLAEKLFFSKRDNLKEPILLSLLKNISKPSQKTYSHEKASDGRYKDDQNCTYIVHEDSSSATSTSQSDNSSDERNKLHLRLHLDNSDTDTSSDSARDKSSSEYIPNQHILPNADSTQFGKSSDVKQLPIQSEEPKIDKHALKPISNSSSDSTSYVDLKPYDSGDVKMLNTAGLPCVEENDNKTATPLIVESISPKQTDVHKQSKMAPQGESLSATLSCESSKPTKSEDENKTAQQIGKSSTESQKSDVDTADYSLDFTSSPLAGNKDVKVKIDSTESVQEKNLKRSPNKNSSLESHQNSQSSQSSVSISDVADLISERSTSFGQHNVNNDNNLSTNKLKLLQSNHDKNISTVDQNNDESVDFSESIPSLSNLSLDIHSD